MHLKKLCYIATGLIFILLSSEINAQISFGGKPITINNSAFTHAIPVYTMPAISTDELLAEDAIDAQAIDIPMRFAADLQASYNLNSDGIWIELDKGDRLWLAAIKSAGAYSLHFIFNDFYLPDGARLFLYNETGQHLGSFTSENNTKEMTFATSPLAGELIYIELYEPYYAKGQSQFEINNVLHAYRNIFGLAKDYGQSGACNINVNCPQGSPWQNQKRSVALILTSNNTRICTGALVNNVRQDGTPYFLTANHCLSGTTSNSWIFMFNYESPSCTNVNGPTNQTVQGSVIRAKGVTSDFALLELTTPPPLAYNVYYAGWNSLDQAPDSSVCIHHPSGDIKKITFDYDTAVSYGYSSAGNDHWRIPSWSAGTTEGGSSGSPLFDKNKRVVGQLHGGTASCTNTSGYDAYGKFSYSWDTGTTPATRLKDWLDPDNTGSMQINGADFNTPLYNFDAALNTIIEPAGATLCDLTLTPQISFRNNGSNNLTSLTIYYSLNGAAPQSTTWNGSLSFPDSETFNLPALQLSEGTYTLTIYVSVPGNTDQNSSNDTLTVSFTALLGNHVSMSLKTDNYPTETSWLLLDSAGTQLYSSAALAAQTSYNELFCLPNGCYKYVIEDTYGDGLAGGGWPPSPAGSYMITFLGDTLGFGSGNFGDSDTIAFCVNQASIELLKSKMPLVNIYPNPASDIIYIETNANEILNLDIFTVLGSLVYSDVVVSKHHPISTSGLREGLYHIRLSGTYGNSVYKVLITY